MRPKTSSRGLVLAFARPLAVHQEAPPRYMARYVSVGAPCQRTKSTTHQRQLISDTGHEFCSSRPPRSFHDPIGLTAFRVIISLAAGVAVATVVFAPLPRLGHQRPVATPAAAQFQRLSPGPTEVGEQTSPRRAPARSSERSPLVLRQLQARSLSGDQGRRLDRQRLQYRSGRGQATSP